MTALRYDPTRRRLWIAGQRCHHGATGAVMTAVFAAALLARREHVVGCATLAAAGGLLMAHDWHDRAIWFRPGHQHQP
jgi:hypothetical protein